MNIPPFLESIDSKEFDKGWSYSNVYFLEELRDISWIIFHNKSLKKDELISLIENRVSAQGAKWTSRRIYECLNALVNFKIIDKNLKPLKSWFKQANISSSLTEDELTTFKHIYFTYNKFIDYHSLFIDGLDVPTESDSDSNMIMNEMLNNSNVLIVSSDNGKYINNFGYIHNDTAYSIPPNMTPVMVFWDVYVKWGKTLKLLERISIVDLPHSVLSNLLDKRKVIGLKNVSLVYFVSNEVDVDVNKFIHTTIKKKYIYIPELIVLMCIEYRINVEYSKEILVNYVQENRSAVSLERTSEMFIRTAEKQFYPVINDSYISHLLLR